MKSNPALSGGLLKSKPTWPNAFGSSTTSAFFVLSKAAYEGHIPAIYSYALECSAPDQRRRWLRQAAEAGNVEAMYTYAKNVKTPLKQSIGCGRPPGKAMFRRCTTTRCTAMISMSEGGG